MIVIDEKYLRVHVCIGAAIRYFELNLNWICIISSSYVNSNWSYSPETVKLSFDLCDFDLWPLTLTFCMDVTFVTDNNSWKFHDDRMMGT